MVGEEPVHAGLHEGPDLPRQIAVLPRIGAGAVLGGEEGVLRPEGPAVDLETRGVGVGDHGRRLAEGVVGLPRDHDVLAGAENVRFIRAAVQFLYPLLAPRSLHAVYIHYPDPHLRSRGQHKVINEALLDAVNKQIVEMRNNGTYDEIYDKYFSTE